MAKWSGKVHTQWNGMNRNRMEQNRMECSLGEGITVAGWLPTFQQNQENLSKCSEIARISQRIVHRRKKSWHQQQFSIKSLNFFQFRTDEMWRTANFRDGTGGKCPV